MNTVWHSLCRVIRMRLEDKKNTACYHWPRPVSVVIQLPSTRMVFLSSSTVLVRLVLSVSLCLRLSLFPFTRRGTFNISPRVINFSNFIFTITIHYSVSHEA